MKRTKKSMLFIVLIAVIISCNTDKKKESNNQLTIKSDIVSKVQKSDSYPNMESLKMEDVGLVGSFVIKDLEQFQAVYSSQNYGTFYQIYCKPHIQGDKLDSLEFSIENYKGPLNLGFAENSAPKENFNYDKEDGILGLRLDVKAFGPYKTLVIDVSNKNITKADLNGLFIYRVLLRMNDGNKGMSDTGVFDTEFYTRSGRTELPKERLEPGLDGYFVEEKGDFNLDVVMQLSRGIKPKNTKPFIVLAAGKNCYTSTNIVVWP